MEFITFLFLLATFLGFGIWLLSGWAKARAETKKEIKGYHSLLAKSEFYMECRHKGIEEINTPHNMEKVLLVAKKYNNAITKEQVKQNYIQSRECAFEFAQLFYDFHRTHPEKPPVKEYMDYPTTFDSTEYANDVKRFFNIDIGTPVYNMFFILGKQIYNASPEAILEAREEEEALQEFIDRYIYYRGREKRLQMLTDYREMLIEQRAEKRTINSSDFMQKEHDWALIGGLASGIAGAAAGIATAMDAQAKNTQIRQNNAQIAASIYEINQKIQDNIDALENNIKNFEQSIEETHIKLIGEMDDATSKTLMNELVLADSDITVTKTGAAIIEVTVQAKQKQNLFDGAVLAQIDGIIKAEFFSDNEAVGYAYLTLPMFGCDTSPSTLTGICTSTTDPNAKYSVKYSPVSLWLIER